ncbi:MAG: hypothetical protein WC347_02790 [Smithellaceae bacterium]|jgi:hypothetical protein
MTLEELYRDAVSAKEQSSVVGLSLHVKKGFKFPAGFPRGELLNETDVGRVYSFNADKIIAWVMKQPQFCQDGCTEK